MSGPDSEKREPIIMGILKAGRERHSSATKDGRPGCFKNLPLCDTHDIGRRPLQHRREGSAVVEVERDVVRRGARTDDECLFTFLILAGSMLRRVDDLTSKGVLTRDGSGHLGSSPSEAGGEDDVRDGELALDLLAVERSEDGDVPLLGSLVVGRLGWNNLGSVPDVELEDWQTRSGVSAVSQDLAL